jgi:hypothetical protein
MGDGVKTALYNIDEGLKESLVCVIDILGYKELMNYKNSQKGNEVLSMLRKIFTKALGYAKNMSQLSGTPKCYLKAYTDNILIAFPLVKKEPFPRQFITFNSIITSLYQQFLINDILVRGACDIGEIYVDGDFVFGKSLIEAHKLESKIAKYPRVVLSDKLMKKFKQIYLSPNPPKYTGNACDEWDFARNSNKKFLLEANGVCFLNYLQLCELGDLCVADFPIEDYSLFAYHQNFVLKRTQTILSNRKDYKDAEEFNKIIEKYLWLAYYHNYYLNDLINRCEDSSGEEYLINIESVFGKEFSITHPDYKFVEFEDVLEAKHQHTEDMLRTKNL